MTNYIVETYNIGATIDDLLQTPSRLSSMPFGGTLTIEASADVCTGANYLAMTVLTPDGDIPFENMRIPANGYDTANAVLHDATQFTARFSVAQGAHFRLSLVKNGTVDGFVRVTFAW